jgi:hypothetical protein
MIMTHRMPLAIAFLALTPILAGCGSRLPLPPTAPTAAASTAPTAPQPSPGTVATVSGERWNLTTTVTSATGPDVCAAALLANLGKSHEWLMVLQLSPGAIRLFVSDASTPTDRWQYDGTTLADQFSAALPGSSGYWLCGSARFDYRSEDHILGRFSQDGRALTGEEVDSYQLTTGETLSLHYEWNAIRSE